MTDTIQVPLNRLALWDGNVRKTGITGGIAELAASIASHGLLQSIVVRKSKRGKYQIIAGQRRFLALQELAKQDRIAEDHPVPCMLADGSIDASELSLAENVVRAPMHPADQFEAFRTLIDDGASVADVAARFGIVESVVVKRLKLGRLSPTILNAYRADEIGLEEAQAFAVTDDQAAQERVFFELTSWNREPHTIRRLLTVSSVPTSDKRVRFIGTDAYLAAGGVISQDLFCEEGSGYLQDSVLLDQLVSDKLAVVAADVSAEGWRWVEVIPGADHGIYGNLQRRSPEHQPLSETDRAEYERLSAEYDALADDDGADDDRLAELEQRIDALDRAREYWPAETLAMAGAVVRLNYNGDAQIDRGLVRKEDVREMVSESEAEAGSATARTVSLSPRLVEDLTAQKSAVIGAALMVQPDIALAAVVHCLALDAFYLGHGVQSCLKLSLGWPSLSRAMAKPDSCKGLMAIEQERERITGHIPGNANDLWDWLIARSRDELLDLLAFIAAGSVDAVQRKEERPDCSRLAHAKALGETLRFEMTEWFRPTAENYFGHISRSLMLSAVDEAQGTHAPALEKLKKDELAVRAESLVSGTGWMPEPLRMGSEAPVDQAEAMPLAAE